MRQPPDSERPPSEASSARVERGNAVAGVELENHSTAEVSQPTVMTVDEARAVVGRIRQCVAITDVEVTKAFNGRAWIALGYPSWSALCDAEFADFRLSREARIALVGELRKNGMSVRAIAATTRADRNTVRADLRQVGELSPTPGQAGEDGEAHDEHLPDDAQEHLHDHVRDVEVVQPRNITGIDGKTYRRRSPQDPAPRRRKPITDTAWTLANDIRRITDRVAKLRSDDRVLQHPNRPRLDELVTREAVELGVQLQQLVEAIHDGGYIHALATSVPEWAHLLDDERKPS
jgi:hypothetical protein